MAINNSLAHGQRSAIWSSLDNATGLFCLSAAAMPIFMALSVSSLTLYAALASRAKGMLTRPTFSRWVSRVVGSTFIGFGTAILTMRRQSV